MEVQWVYPSLGEEEKREKTVEHDAFLFRAEKNHCREIKTTIFITRHARLLLRRHT